MKQRRLNHDEKRVGTMMRTALLWLTLCAAGAQAQHQPYAGEEQRDIKALSAEQVQQYLAGAGMGYAKAAELNHFPGPMHVLELGDGLNLTPEQRTRAIALMQEHKAEARAIGANLVESQRELDALFRSGRVEDSALGDAVRAVARLEGEYRLSHLETHWRMRALLTDDQVAAYDRLRGYASDRDHGARGVSH